LIVKPDLFLSDLHLSPERPAMVAAFEAFCLGPARAAGRVHVLGDLFDAWVGDDQVRDPVAARVANALAELSATGVEVGLMCGNRDFLLGERFATAAGARLLPDPIVVGVGGVPTVLLHGDTLCTDDVGYQKFRLRTRDARTQRRFLALPYAVRRGLFALIRLRSRHLSAAKSEVIMDVSADAVAGVFRQHDVTRMIHGHTHRPARHLTVIDGRERERWVLPDWYDRGGYLAAEAGTVAFREIAA
jgi:UDP-2,3-diacylglucosamine hydrolase